MQFATESNLILSACQEVYLCFSLNFMHLRDQVVHMCCAACWALDCSLGRTKQLRPSVGFCS